MTPPAATAPPDPERLAILAFHNVPASLHGALRQGDLADALAEAISFATLPLVGEQPLLLVGPPAPARR